MSRQPSKARTIAAIGVGVLLIIAAIVFVQVPVVAVPLALLGIFCMAMSPFA